MAVLVRRATDHDLDAVRFVGFATWPSTYGAISGPGFVVAGLDEYWSAEAIAGAIRDGNVDVALEGDAVVGMSQVDVLDGDLVMWKLYVLPGRQGSGVGTALLDAVVRRATHEGRGLLTEYVAGNESAGGFYRSHGFVDTADSSPGGDAVWLRHGGG